MDKRIKLATLGVLLAIAACGSDDKKSGGSNDDAAGATGGSGGAAGGSGGRGGSGGGGSGGSAGTGGSGGSAGSGGSGGSAGTGGSGGSGGTGGARDAGADQAASGDARPAGDTRPADARAGDAGSMTLTSANLMEGAMFMAVNTCAGMNVSPPLTWTAGPAGTMSYAIELQDLTNSLIHWVIWDIPATVTMLPAMLPGGSTLTMPVMAKQASIGNQDAYQGPCPGGNVHMYRFTVFALDAATLPGVTAMSSPMAVRMAIRMHTLAFGTLTGTSNASRR